MQDLPRERALDSTAQLLADPYRWIARRAAHHGRPLLQARIMGEPTICITGPDAARVFYTPGNFTRRGALPKPILWLLQDEGSVTVLDGAPHAVRKRMFLSLMTPPRLAKLDERFRSEWSEAVDRWSDGREVVLDDAVRAVIFRAVCGWAGVPLAADEADRRAADMMAMFDGAGALGRRRVHAWTARRRTERWMGDLAAQVRNGRLAVEPGTAFAAMAEHRDADGAPLSDEILMTEMVNVIRPTVAVARYITFAALALQANPSERRLLESAARQPSSVPDVPTAAEAVDDHTDPVWRFVQEVRRTAPFFPLLGGRVLQPFRWEGHDFTNGTRVLLDLYGTNHDPVTWPQPDEFLPERFLGWTGDPYRLIPQGAGDPATDHRCPGEWIAILLMKIAVRELTTGMDYAVASQDLRLRMTRIPTRPASGFTIRAVRRRPPTPTTALESSIPSSRPRSQTT